MGVKKLQNFVKTLSKEVISTFHFMKLNFNVNSYKCVNDTTAYIIN